LLKNFSTFSTMTDYIKNIIDNFIDRDNFLADKLFPEFSLQLDEANPEQFSIQLADHLYKNYYCRDHTSSKKKADALWTREAFTNRLASMFQGETISYDHGWEVSDTDPNGHVYVSKGHYRNLFSAGHYLSESYSQPVSSGAKVQKAITRYSCQEGDYFFYIHGKIPGEYINNFMVRYYFNVQAIHAPDVIHTLVTALDKHLLPFEMKCPADPKSFDRKDSVVLYLNKRYHHIFQHLLNDTYPELLDLLDSDIPLFTRKVFPGIGFGESPPKNNTSFGMSRCDLIAQALSNCVKNKTPRDDWMNSIMDDIKRQGFSPHHFYLNPYNSFPYDFSNQPYRNN
jgi:hypothetical protein